MSTLDSPIPLSDLESVLAWVDSYKLTRPTRKINRDFSDAVLLAEILSVHYPKLVEMHNYPPRNSQALKLNNWMTLNRKVLKKLRLNLCCNTMEKLANCAPGVIERVLIMVRDKIRRDEELNKSMKDGEQNLSSGGSYYEASGDDANILVVPVKTRVNGVLETINQKVVSYDSYQNLKEELKDAKETIDMIKQKVEHLDDMIKLKDERIDELQRQLDRKQSRRIEVEALQNSLAVPFDAVPSPVVADVLPVSRKSSLRIIDSSSKIPKPEIYQNKTDESKIPIPKVEKPVKNSNSKSSITGDLSKDLIFPPDDNTIKLEFVERKELSVVEDARPIPVFMEENKVEIKEVLPERSESLNNVQERSQESLTDLDEFKDSEQGVTTVSEIIQKEIKDIVTPSRNPAELNYFM